MYAGTSDVQHSGTLYIRLHTVYTNAGTPVSEHRYTCTSVLPSSIVVHATETYCYIRLLYRTRHTCMPRYWYTDTLVHRTSKTLAHSISKSRYICTVDTSVHLYSGTYPQHTGTSPMQRYRCLRTLVHLMSIGIRVRRYIGRPTLRHTLHTNTGIPVSEYRYTCTSVLPSSIVVHATETHCYTGLLY